MRLCIVCHDGPLTISQDFCCSEACAAKYAQDNLELARAAEVVILESTPKCRVCAAALSKRQRLYCSRRCNHRAEHARWKLREAQAAATKLEAEVAKPRLVGIDGDGKLVYAEVTQAEQFSRLVADGRRAITPPTSWWQRLRRRVAVAWATLRYLLDEHSGN